MVKKIKRALRSYYEIYLMLIPVIAYFIIFHYYPMFGLQIAFKDFKASEGIWGSAWVGFKHFKRFFSSPVFTALLTNTFKLSLYSLVAGFIPPIILALMLNYQKCAPYRVVETVNTVILIVFGLIIAYPLYFVIIASISSPSAVNAGEVMLWPKDINFLGYKKILSNKDVISGAVNTVFYTATATLLNVFITMLGAYAISVRFPGRKIMVKMITFTMFFSGGMIPSYLLMRDLNLLDTYLVMIINGMVSAYNLFVARTFIESNIPNELFEAAEMDGCNRTRFFFKIVWPLSGTIIAILALFYASGHWNSYMNGVLYLRDRSKFPLQMILREILIQNQISTSEMMMSSTDLLVVANQQEVADLMKYALIIVTIVPMMVAYPFLQKYFVKGVMIGSVKG